MLSSQLPLYKCQKKQQNKNESNFGKKDKYNTATAEIPLKTKISFSHTIKIDILNSANPPSDQL